MHTIHDSGYKKLFSNKTIFRQLIETFVTEEWVNELDFTHCETLDKSFVSAHYKKTESDLIYKVRFRGRDAYLIVLLEFQSTVDRFMALRVLKYLADFYMDYAHSSQGVRMLPPVFPIVLYNADERWTAPTAFADLVEQADLFGEYVPRFRYFKIVEQEYPKETLLRIRNIVSTLFLAEAYYDRDLLTKELEEIFEREEDRHAASLLLNWFRQLAEHRVIKPSDYQVFERVYQNTEEVKGMLITALEREREQMREQMLPLLREEAREEVRVQLQEEVRGEVREEVRVQLQEEVRGEVREEAMSEGLLNAIAMLLESKFGDAGKAIFYDLSSIHHISTLQRMLKEIIAYADIAQVKNALAEILLTTHENGR